MALLIGFVVYALAIVGLLLGVEDSHAVTRAGAFWAAVGINAFATALGYAAFDATRALTGERP